VLLFQVSSPAHKIRKNSEQTSSGSGEDLLRRDSMTTTHSSESDELGLSVVETASLDEAQDRQLKKRKEKLFKAIIAGDTQLVCI
jgi:hypothetical protein